MTAPAFTAHSFQESVFPGLPVQPSCSRFARSDVTPSSHSQIPHVYAPPTSHVLISRNRNRTCRRPLSPTTHFPKPKHYSSKDGNREETRNHMPRPRHLARPPRPKHPRNPHPTPHLPNHNHSSQVLQPHKQRRPRHQLDKHDGVFKRESRRRVQARR
jgi:hypothetical protein